jgi:general secretion pathway protein K
MILAARSTIFPAWHGRPAEHGFILVTVLWIIAGLATLASVYSVYVDNIAMASHVEDDQLRAHVAVLSALELAALKLSSAPTETRPASGTFAFRIDRSAVHVNFINEGARIDLNAAPNDVLAGLFVRLGAQPDDAAGFADRIVAWRERATDAEEDTEAAAYKSAGYAYPPRQAPLQDPLELRLVRGIPAALVDRVLPFVTIFSGRAKVDVRVADPIVLSALPKSMPESIQKVMAQRVLSPEDGESMLELLGAAGAGASATGGATIRIGVDVRIDDGAVARVEAVILLADGDEEPYHVLSWRDASDGPL